ncbi:MAG: ArsI/CadI family heavy metal resistance metalloenzyme [Pyrinomonadaceae bacterium]
MNVRALDDSVRFYKKLFGIEPLKHIRGRKADRQANSSETSSVSFGYAKFDVENPPLNFVLNEVPYTEGGTLSHLGLQVASSEDVLTTRERWIAEGLLTVDEMKVDCCYALQDKTWTRDPDGNEWEVFVVLENTEPTANACTCGSKVENAELSTAACCTPGERASTIGASNQPCC